MSGCIARPPIQPRMEPEAALDLIAERDALVHSLRGRVSAVLQDNQGSRVWLDGALAIGDNGDMRLQLGKFGRNAFDLTRRSDEVWLWVDEKTLSSSDAWSDSADRGSDDGHAFVKLAELLAWLVRRPDLREGYRGASEWVSASPESGSSDMWTITTDTYTASIGRKRLLVESITPREPGRAGLGMINIEFPDYRVDATTGLAYCRSLALRFQRADAPDSPTMFFSLSLHDEELNAEIPDAAFRPARRATRIDR